MLSFPDIAQSAELSRRAGPKAALLARAFVAGMPVPEGLVLPAAEALPSAEELDAALVALAGRAARAGVAVTAGRFVVRSSAPGEDLPGRSAAGLFRSEVQVPLAQVAAAIQAVRASAESLALRRYQQERGAGTEALAVLLQPQVAALRLGVLQLLPDGAALTEERAATEPEWAGGEQRRIGAGALLRGAQALRALVPQAPATIQVEYAVSAGEQVVFLQARAAPPLPNHDPALWPPPPDLGEYRFDQAHNPEPLSPAQAALVALVNDPETSPTFQQHLSRGYLYYAPRPGAAAPTVARERLADALAHLLDVVMPSCDRQLRRLEATLPEVALEDARATFRFIYRVYVGELSPALAQARGLLAGQPALLLGLSTVTSARAQALWALGDGQRGAAGLRRFLTRYGAYAPAWDVACPADEEEPERVLALALALRRSGPAPRERQLKARTAQVHAVAAQAAALPAAERPALLQRVYLARTAQVLAEADDAIFFRAQRLVRRALLAEGARLCAAGRLTDPSDIFFLDPPRSRAQEANEHHDLRAEAAQGRLRWQEQRRLRPPERFIAGRPEWSPWTLRGHEAVLRGIGVPGPDAAPRRGAVRLVTALASPPDARAIAGAVLVLPVLLPSWAPLLTQAAALVTDSGGALSHGATLARELGIPAVVGTGAATAVLRDGDEVVVDAAAGRVYR